MSRGKRQVDDEDFDEYAIWDDRMRGYGRARLEDVPSANQDYGAGPGYLGRVGQSPRSPSIRGDDEIRPSRRRSPSPDDSDRGGERRGLRKVGDAFDPDDVFDEPGRISSSLKSAVKNAVLSRTVFRDWCLSTNVSENADATSGGNLAFLRQQRVLNGDSLAIRLNNVQLRGCAYVKHTPNDLTDTPTSNPAVFVEVVVLYDRSRSALDASFWNSTDPISAFSWSDAFSPSVTTFVYPAAVNDLDPKVFNFTNPEMSNRVRVMFRKIYKLSPRNYVNTYANITGTAVNADPLLNYSISLDAQAYTASGYPIAEYNMSSASACVIDEFVNLCNLPARYRAGDTLATAVDTEGAVYIGVRGTSLSSARANVVSVYINTRLNFNMDSSDPVVFY